MVDEDLLDLEPLDDEDLELLLDLALLLKDWPTEGACDGVKDADGDNDCEGAMESDGEKEIVGDADGANGENVG